MRAPKLCKTDEKEACLRHAMPAPLCFGGGDRLRKHNVVSWEGDTRAPIQN